MADGRFGWDPKPFHDLPRCIGTFCVFHNPSKHPLRRARKKMLNTGLVVRRCDHSLLHPDPDSAYWYAQAVGRWRMAENEYAERVFNTLELHECDGCCK